MSSTGRASSFDRSGVGADRGYSASQRGSYAGSADRVGQAGQTMRAQDRQTGRTDRTQARTDLGGDRQQGRTDRTQARQDGRTDRSEGRQDVRGDRQQAVTDRQQNRQDYRSGAREDWQDYYDDHHGYWGGYSPWGYAAAGAIAVGAAYAIGTAISASAFHALPCTATTVVVSGVTYYQCGTTWYSQAYSGGDVTYVVVETPAGY